MVDNCVIYSTSNPTLKVTIGTNTIDENYTKGLTTLAIPKGSNQQNKEVSDIPNNYDVRVLDILGKLERRITISGYLSTGLGTTDTNTNAIDKANDLKLLFMKGGTFLLDYYGGTEVQVNADKLEIKKVPNDNNNNLDGVAEFDVTISLIVGTDMI
jgi:hypothetical protein